MGTTPFENYVEIELPLRDSSIRDLAGDPNVSANPRVTNAPRGTWFIPTDNPVQRWHKVTQSSNTWVLINNSGSGTLVVIDEEANGLINGFNKLFTTNSNYATASLTVFLNGIQQLKNTEYTETSANSFTFATAPIGGSDPDTVTVRYVQS
jgi:hypothetical protein